MTEPRPSMRVQRLTEQLALQERPVHARVETVIRLLKSIGTPEPGNRFAGLRDTMAGAKGRCVGFWTGWAPVEIHGLFSRSSKYDCYTLEFTLTVRPDAEGLSIVEAALKVAELHAQAPQFTPDELPEVYAALDAILGPVKSEP